MAVHPYTILIIFSITTVSGDLGTLKNDSGCRSIGGVCQETYYGCQSGKFVPKLCPGPSSWQCCVKPPDPKGPPAPWRMCYECSYSVSNGVERGYRHCHKFSNDSKLAVLPQTNCTGNCTKEWLKLDKENYSLVRRCTSTCDAFGVYSGHTLHCCNDDLCNTSSLLHALPCNAFMACLAISILSLGS